MFFQLDDAASAASHCEALDAMKDVREVRLSGNTLGVEAAKALAASIAKHPGLVVRHMTVFLFDF